MKKKKFAPKAGYEAICPSVVDSLKMLERSRSTETVYQAILKAGCRGVTRHELLQAMGDDGKGWASITARVGELRTQGWVRHKVMLEKGKRVLVRRADPTGRENTVLVAVPHYEDIFTDLRFGQLRMELHERLQNQRHYLKQAAEEKALALDALRRIHRKLRKVHAK